MFCTNCGNQIPEGAKFCTHCGTPVAGAQQPQPQQPFAQPYQQPNGQFGGQPQQPYGQPYYGQPPVRKLNTSRGLLKFILLSLITLGIYSIVAFSSVSESINIAASRYDGKKTMHFCLLFFVISPLTLGIATFVWFHKLSNRVGGECARRGLNYRIGASDFWIWYFLLSIIIVGPFIYLHKLFKAMNLICADYNARG